jgi:hypothetical protein
MLMSARGLSPVPDFLSSGKIHRNTVALAESLGIGTGCSVVCDEIIVAIAIDGQKKVAIRLPRHIPAESSEYSAIARNSWVLFVKTELHSEPPR